VSRRGWILFSLMSVVWGIPYLLIKVAVDEVPPTVLVFARTAIGAALLLPLAVRSGQLAMVRRHWKPVLAFALLEILAPWWLLSDAELRLSSSTTGLLIAAAPVLGVAVARLSGIERLSVARWIGLALGLVGVAVLIGPEIGGGDAWSFTEVLLAALGYALAPLIADRYLPEIPTIPLTAACLGVAALAYAPAAAWHWPSTMPSGTALAAVAGLGVVCTGVAFVAYVELIREVGPSRSLVFIYVNPAVAVVAGVLILDEPLTALIVASFVLILIGCALATRAETAAPPPAGPATREAEVEVGS
jgi:drug/metabolite transporter (DMT)-like permease